MPFVQFTNASAMTTKYVAFDFTTLLIHKFVAKLPI